jgi:hypothetical protein
MMGKGWRLPLLAEAGFNRDYFGPFPGFLE